VADAADAVDVVDAVFRRTGCALMPNTLYTKKMRMKLPRAELTHFPNVSSALVAFLADHT